MKIKQNNKNSALLVRNTFLLTLLFGMSFLSSCMPIPGTEGEKSELEFTDKEEEKKKKESSGRVPSGLDAVKVFERTVYPIVRNNSCVSCHGGEQSPKFAVADVNQAYINLVSAAKIDLTDPSKSRIVRKIIDQSHNCWSDCGENSDEMLRAVEALANAAGGSDQGLGGIRTGGASYPAIDSTAQTEYGTLILQAEQEFPGVLNGRFVSLIDSKALGQKFMTGPAPARNPHTNATRQSRVTLNACQTPSAASLNDFQNGPFQISETSTHVNSETRRTRTTNRVVKDGYAPFSYRIEGRLIRPDKRLDYAKALLARDFSTVQTLLLFGGKFVDDNITPGKPVGLQDGSLLSFNSFEILPHFVAWDDVFESNGSFKAASESYTKDDGTTASLYELFSDGAYEPLPGVVYDKMRDLELQKQKILYRDLKRSSAQFMSRRNLTYFRVDNMDLEYFLSTENLEVAYDCPDSWIGQESTPVFSRSAGAPYRTCDPNNTNFPGRYRDLVPEVITAKSVLTPLTYENSLDKLSVSNNGLSIVAASASDLSSGNWFHRIDLFAHYVINPNLKRENGDFSNLYESGQSGGFRTSENFSADTSVGVNGRVTWDLQRAAGNLDLSGVFAGAQANLDERLEIENFEQTLFPVLRGARCLNCHTSGDQARFAQENSALAMKVIKDQNLVNFQDPGDSFRGRAGGIVHNCVQGSGNAQLNCNNDASLRASFIDAIRAWKNANSVDSSGDGVQALSLAQRTPGYAKYEFNVKDSGYYNIWMRGKSDGNNDKRINFRVLNSSGTPVRALVRSGNNINQKSSTCQSLSFEDAEWIWKTRGRASELSSLDFRGNRIKDNSDNLIPVPDQRDYWNLVEGTYSIELFEDDIETKIDLIALNKVDDFSVEGRINFQPDLRTRDEKYISSYKRKILRYDLSSLVALQAGESAFFEIEVREEFDGQNYVFRAPRFFFENRRNKVLKIKGIRGLINGKHEFTDATYSQVAGKVALGRVITYAPLLTLIPDPDAKASNQFSFVFDELSIENGPVDVLNPKGELPELANERSCLELELFTKTVKPILKQVRLTLNSSLDDLIDGYPGNPERRNTGLETYTCMECHNERHPYFKMTTFDFNDDILCKQALSRVDFQNFYQSTIVRGLNGTNNHPKFVFTEELFFKDTNKDEWDIHDRGNDYVQGFVRHPSGYRAQYMKGPFAKFTRADLNIPNTNFSNLNSAQQEQAKWIGSFKGIRLEYLPTNSAAIGGYNDLLHFNLLGGAKGERDIIDVNHIPNLGTPENPRDEIDPIVVERDRAGAVMFLQPDSAAYRADPRVFTNLDNFSVGDDYDNLVMMVQKNGDNKMTRSGGDKVIDYRQDMNGYNSREDLNVSLEELRTKYREAIMDWIRAEDRAFKAAN